MSNLDSYNQGHPLNKDEWLEKIMDEYGERLTKLAYNYLKDWSLAQDVIQEVFVSCYKQYESIDSITSFKAWIFRITINRCKDMLKSSHFRKVVVNTTIFKLFSAKGLSPEDNLIKQNEEEKLCTKSTN